MGLSDESSRVRGYRDILPQTSYCYYCHVHHPIEKMRQIEAKGGKRMRFIKSTEAAMGEISKRDAFGLSECNRAAAQASARITNSR